MLRNVWVFLVSNGASPITLLVVSAPAQSAFTFLLQLKNLYDMLDLMDISDSNLGVILPEEKNTFDQWSPCSHEGVALQIDEAVKELVNDITIERAQNLFVQLIEMSYDACCPETQLLILGVAAGARVLIHRRSDETHLSGLWLARMQNAQKLLAVCAGSVV